MRDMKPCPFCDGAGRVNKSRFLRSDSPVREGIEVEVVEHEHRNMNGIVYARTSEVLPRVDPGAYTLYPRPQVEGDDGE